MMRLTLFFILMLCFSIENQAGNVITRAKVVEKIAPDYPEKALESRQEGWVIVSYVVDTDGNVSNATVDDSTGNKQFEREALKAIKKWKYEPAKLDGEPTQQCETKAKINFIIKSSANGATRNFVFKFRDIVELLAEDNIAQAELKLTELADNASWNLYEDAWYWYLMANLYQKKGDQEGLYTSIKRAVAYEGKYLPDEQYLAALKILFKLEAQRFEYLEALDTYESIVNASNSADNYEYQTKIVNAIHTLLASEKTIRIPAKFNDSGAWTLSLARKTFSISDTQGKAQKLEVWCDAKLQNFKIIEDHTWTVPENWGACTLKVYGDQGASFMVHLPPDTATNQS